MSAFSSVTSRLAAGTVGQLAYGADGDKYVRSYVLVDATDVPPGYGVSYDATNDSVKLFAALGTLMGVAFDDGSLPIETAVYDNAGWPNVPVLRKGQVWVALSQDVVPTDDVYCQAVAGVGKPQGSFRKDNDGGNAVKVVGAQFATAGTAASGKVVLEVNLPA